MALSPLERRRRAASRRALYASLAIVLLASTAFLKLLWRPLPLDRDESWTELDYEHLPVVELLQDYVRVDTSPTTGSELAGARFLAARLAAAGIASHVERLGEKGANLWAVIEGEDPEALVLHHHIDVTPVPDPGVWDFPPFAATIHRPWIYGRGVFDMKSVAVAQLEAFLRVARQGRPPHRTLVLLATGGEESGSDLGTRWLLRQHPELVSRFWGVLTEGGVVEATSTTEVKYWGIELAQKRFAEATACSASRDRLEELSEDLALAGKPNYPRRLTPEVETFLRSYGGSRDRDSFRRFLEDPSRSLADQTAFDRLPPLLRSLFRDELVTFPVEEDPEGGFRLPLVFHLLPGSDFADARRRLLPAWTTEGVALAVGVPAGADHGSPPDHPLFITLARLLASRHPGATIGPYFLPWSATDARFFRAAGIPAYGFSPFLILSTDTLQVDSVNERISLPGFVAGVELYAEAVRAFTG